MLPADADAAANRQVQRRLSSAAAAPAPVAGGGAGGDCIRVKAVVNIGRVELEMLRNLPEHRIIEPLARFQARLLH